MQKKGRRLTFAGVAAATGVAAAVLFSTFGATAEAATNPYTPESACAKEFGGNWVRAKDGHRAIKHNGSKWGDVYLMYNPANGDNCLATIKSRFVGKKTWTVANLWIKRKGDDLQRVDKGNYKYYAATKAAANGKCVKYYGWVYNIGNNYGANNGRGDWGNCN